MDSNPRARSCGLLLSALALRVVSGGKADLQVGEKFQVSDAMLSAAQVAETIKTEEQLYPVLMYGISQRDGKFFEDLLKEILTVHGWDTRKLARSHKAYQFPGYTAMHYVCLPSQHKVVDVNGKSRHMKALINAGLDVNVETEDGSGILPIHVCAANGQPEAFKALLDAGAAVDIFTKNSKMSAATMAARAGGPHCLKVLRVMKDAGGKAAEMLMTRDGADREPKNWDPLLYAARNERLDHLSFFFYEVVGRRHKISWKEVLHVAKEKVAEGKTTEEYVTSLEKLAYNKKFFKEQRAKHMKVILDEGRNEL